MALLGQLIVGAVAMGNPITITGAEQQVGSEIGYMIGQVDYVAVEAFDPAVPHGIGNANLGVSIAEPDYIASGAASLTSLFGANQVTVGGSTDVSATWIGPPPDADDIHVGAGSSFLISFVVGLSPVQLNINGAIEVSLVAYPDLHPEETFTYMRLSSLGTPLWEERLDGTDSETSRLISHSEPLTPGQEYVLEAYAESGTVATLDHHGAKSRNSSFYFTATVPEPTTIEGTVDIDPDTLNLQSKGNWITCYIELPEGYDVAHIDIGSILLNGVVPAENKPTEIGDYDDDGLPDLMVKFDRSDVCEILDPGDEVEITVTGELTDETPCQGSDTIRVIDKGGKK